MQRYSLLALKDLFWIQGLQGCREKIISQNTVQTPHIFYDARHRFRINENIDIRWQWAQQWLMIAQSHPYTELRRHFGWQVHWGWLELNYWCKRSHDNFTFFAFFDFYHETLQLHCKSSHHFLHILLWLAFCDFLFFYGIYVIDISYNSQDRIFYCTLWCK